MQRAEQLGVHSFGKWQAHTKYGNRSLKHLSSKIWDNIDLSQHNCSQFTFEKQYRDIGYLSLHMMTDRPSLVLKHGVLHLNCSPLLFHIAHSPLIIFPSHIAIFIPCFSSPYCTYSHSFPHLRCVCLPRFCLFCFLFVYLWFGFLVAAGVLLLCRNSASYRTDSTVATIKRTKRLPRALSQMGRQKYNCVVQKVRNVHQKRKWTWWKWMKRFHDYWDQFIWDHSFETIHLGPRSFDTTTFETTFIWDLFIWDHFIWDHVHLRPFHLRPHSFETFSFETTFIWDHMHLRPQSFETTVIWDHSHLRPHSFETTFIWDLFIWDHIHLRLLHLRPHSFEITFIWDHIHLRPQPFAADT